LHTQTWVAYKTYGENDEKHFHGTVVKIDLMADEDEIWFYYSNDKQEEVPQLLMAALDEQSPGVWWVCE